MNENNELVGYDLFTDVLDREIRAVNAMPMYLYTRVCHRFLIASQPILCSFGDSFLDTWINFEAPMNSTNQAIVTRAYSYVGGKYHSMVAPCGEATLLLYNLVGDKAYSDRSVHPSDLAQYVHACVIYATVTGLSPIGLGDAGTRCVCIAARSYRKILWPFTPIIATAAHTISHSFKSLHGMRIRPMRPIRHISLIIVEPL